MGFLFQQNKGLYSDYKLQRELIMEIDLIEINGNNIAVLKSSGVLIRETQDALDLMAEAGYLKSHKIIIQENQLTPGFFNLKTGIAGEILQKFSTYQEIGRAHV